MAASISDKSLSRVFTPAKKSLVNNSDSLKPIDLI